MTSHPLTYLLDTHTFLWFLTDPVQLPPAISSILLDSDQQLALSIATPWEISIKVAVGKLNDAGVLKNFEALAARCLCTVLPTTVRHVVASGELPLHHRDPFDRLLAAQSLDLNLTLLSRDAIFDQYGVRRLWE